MAASPRSAGKPYLAAITSENGQQRWACGEALPAGSRINEQSRSSQLIGHVAERLAYL